MQAISKMRDIFGSARVVLVLDRNLEEVGEDRHARKMALVVSDRSSRLWTMQEAREAFDEAFIRFRSGMERLSDVVHGADNRTERKPILARILDRDFNRKLALYHARFVGKLNNHHVNPLKSLMFSMARRSTTKPEDGFVWLVSMMRLDPVLLNQDLSMESVLARGGIWWGLRAYVRVLPMALPTEHRRG